MREVSFDEALTAVRARMGEEAAGHSLRVSETAASLAATYGVDIDLARLAGLLHDWDRERSAEELLGAARAAGLEVTDADEAVPYLLHARTGAAALAKELPGIPAEVLSAVERHTVGSAEMNDLDKIVFLADMLEPARDYKGIEKLRAAAGTVSLDELMALGYQRSVMHLVRKRKRIHPQTVEVWNRIVAGGNR